MKLNRLKIIPFLFAGTLYALAKFVESSWVTNFLVNYCRSGIEGRGTVCYAPQLDGGKDSFEIGIFFLTISLILLLANKMGLKLWLIFSTVFLPVAGYFVWGLANSGFFISPEPIGFEGPILLFGVLYVSITLIIVGVSHLFVAILEFFRRKRKRSAGAAVKPF
jgi:hypothetical protein